MEMRDYGAALRRYWTTFLAFTLAGLAGACLVVLYTPTTYRATAQVFVSSTGEGTSGSQFVNQRVTSYPDVARSRAVLGPVMDELGLTDPFRVVRDRVSAVNPVDTSQIDISVTGTDAEQAAEMANAIAEQFGTVVEELERPGGGTSPVDLSVTDPATVPTTPAAPRTGLLLLLGLVVGLGLGAAGAVVRNQLDTTVHTVGELRDAWGGESADVPVHARPAGRARRSTLAGRPATVLARRLERLAEDRPVRLLALSPSPAAELAPWSFVDEVAEELRALGLGTAVTGPDEDAGDRPADAARVQISVGSPLAPLRSWRRIAEDHDAVVLVVAPGRVQRAELAEVRSILSAAGIRPLALVLSPAGRGPAARPHTAPTGPTSGNASPAGTARGAAEPVPTSR
jgi:capsular polysaccharide biosynthesis protein